MRSLKGSQSKVEPKLTTSTSAGPSRKELLFALGNIMQTWIAFGALLSINLALAPFSSNRRPPPYS